eukprot:Em0008g1285a
MIGDRIVVGIRDETMSKRLQLDPDLTLEKAKRIVRQQEAVQEQQKVLKGMEDVTLDEASGSKRHVKGQPDSFPKRQQELEDVSPQQSDLSPVFLDTLSRVIGQFSGKVSHNGRESIETILVVAGLWTNLLGLPAIMALKLVARLEAVTVALVVDTFLALFEGLGNLGEPFEIRLQPGARPYALFTPRNIPIPLRQRVRQELDRMLLLGVISKVDIPSPWCAGMVVVPKKNGDIRISVDFRPLKSSVLSAPKHFQKCVSRILEGIEGVVCQIDDILVFGKDQDQHDTRLMAVLKRVQSAGVTLNKDKYQLKPKWPYLKEFQMQDDRVKKNSKMNFDREHKAQSLPQIPDDASTRKPHDITRPGRGGTAEARIRDSRGKNQRQQRQESETAEARNRDSRERTSASTTDTTDNDAISNRSWYSSSSEIWNVCYSLGTEENLVQKKRVRAGHRASTTRIIAQARENMEQEERNTAALTQQMTALKTKLDLLTALDAEILELTLNEDEIAQEIEHADTYKAQLQTMVFELEGALKTKGKEASTLEVLTCSTEPSRSSSPVLSRHSSCQPAQENGANR